MFRSRVRTLLVLVCLPLMACLHAIGQFNPSQVMSAMQNRQSGLTLVASHRGEINGVYANNMPENSIGALQNAVDGGIEMVEADVWTTQDHVPYVMHDKTLNRTMGISGRSYYNPNPSATSPAAVNWSDIEGKPLCAGRGDTAVAAGGSGVCTYSSQTVQSLAAFTGAVRLAQNQQGQPWGGVLLLDLRDSDSLVQSWSTLMQLGFVSQQVVFKFSPLNLQLFSVQDIVNLLATSTYYDGNTTQAASDVAAYMNFQPTYITNLALAQEVATNNPNWAIDDWNNWLANAGSFHRLLSAEVSVKGSPGEFMTADTLYQTVTSGPLNTISVYSTFYECDLAPPATPQDLPNLPEGSAGKNGYWINNGACNTLNPSTAESGDGIDHRYDYNFITGNTSPNTPNITAPPNFGMIIADNAFVLINYLQGINQRNLPSIQAHCNGGSAYPDCDVNGETTYTLCAADGGTCTFTGDRNVAYGGVGSDGNAHFTTLTLTNSTACNDTTFTNPNPGYVKNCYVSPPISYQTAVYCGDQDQYCNFQGGVSFPSIAANGKYYTKYFAVNNGFQCNASTFGWFSDPIPGYNKACFAVLPKVAVSGGPQGYAYCGSDNGTCLFKGPGRIAYGTSGHYNYQVFNGGTACNVSLFGNPMSGYTNACWYQVATAASGATGTSVDGSGGSGGTPGAGANTTGSTIRQLVAVPAYFYPPSYWSQLVDTGGFAIANVANGPNYGVDSNYASAVAVVHESGTRVLGYVDTGYFGGTSPARTTRLNQTDSADWTTQIEQDVDAWYALYGSNGIDGIFFDDGQNVCSDSNNDYVALYTDIYNYVKQNHPGAFVIANPGTAVPSCLAGIADSLLTFEGSYDCYINDSSCPAGQGYTPLAWNPVDPEKQFHIVYGIPAASLASVSALTKTNNAGLVFLTSATLASNPYGSLPSFFSTTLTDANAGGGADTTTPTAPGTVSTVSIQGTTALLNWAPSTDANGSGVVAYDVYSEAGGGTWVQSVPASTAPQAILTGLSPNTSYNFFVVARTLVGITSASSFVTFTTGPANGTVTAPGIYVDIEGFTDDVISWTPATASTYPVAYYDIFVNGVKTLTVDAGTTSADIIQLLGTLTNLANGVTPPAQQYAITMDARDTNGDVSPLSSVYDIVIPVPPTTDTGCTVTSSSSTVTIACIYYAPWGFHHVYIDADNNTTTGYLFTWTNPAVGADYLIENSTLNAYTGNGSTFSWTPVATITPVVTGVDNSGFTFTWTIPTSAFSVIPLGNTVQYLQDGTGYVPEEYGQVLTCVSGACTTP